VRAENSYDGRLMQTFEDAVRKAERNAIDAGHVIPKLELVTTAVRKSHHQKRMEWMSGDEFYTTHCLECDRELPKVKGTDFCIDCLNEIEAAEIEAEAL
jgi:NAD-dependent DNA ligase